MKKNQVLIAAVVLTVIIAIIDSVFGHAYTCQRASQTFSKTDGVVLKSYGTGYTGRVGHNDAVVIYRYAVKGEFYMSRLYRYLMFYTQGTTEQLLAQYPVGAKVAVFYDSNHPARSVLSPGLNSSDTFALKVVTVVNGSLLVFWLFGLFFPFKK